MPESQRRRHASLARRAAGVPRLGRPRPQALGKKVTSKQAEAHTVALVERELAELDAECARVRRLLRQLAAARRSGTSRDGILGELGASVLHLHVHTKGLDEMLEELD